MIALVKKVEKCTHECCVSKRLLFVMIDVMVLSHISDAYDKMTKLRIEVTLLLRK